MTGRKPPFEMAGGTYLAGERARRPAHAIKLPWRKWRSKAKNWRYENARFAGGALLDAVRVCYAAKYTT